MSDEPQPEHDAEAEDAPPGSVSRHYKRVMFRLSHVGMTIGFCITLGFLLGYWADNQLDTGPWLSILGLALGFAAAAKELLKAVRYARKTRID